MKIYSYIKFKWDKKTQTYQEVDSIFQEYIGEIAQCFGFAALAGAALVGGLIASSSGGGGGGGKTTVRVPGPSEEEEALYQKQLQMLEQQEKQAELMSPHILRSIGLVEDVHEPGEYIPSIWEKTLGKWETPPKNWEWVAKPGEERKVYYRPMTEEEWLAGMTVPEKQQYELALKSQEQAGLAFDFQKEQWKAQQERWGMQQEQWLGEQERAAEQWGYQKEQWATQEERAKEQWEIQQEQWKTQEERTGEQWEFQQEQWETQEQRAKEQWKYQQEQWETQEERAGEQWGYQKEQWETAQAESEAMKPFMLQGMGLVEEDGTYRKMTEEEQLAGMSEVEKGQYELIKLQQERQAQAYAGELPISPALEKSLGQQRIQMEEALSQRLGPGWQMTTAGQQAMGEYSQRADLLREEARRGQISTEGGILLAGMGYLGDVQKGKVQEAAIFPQRQTGLFGTPSPGGQIGQVPYAQAPAYQTGGRIGQVPYAQAPMYQAGSQIGQVPYVQMPQQAGGYPTGGAYAAYPSLSSGLFAGYGQLQQPFQQQRGMQYQANVANAQMKAQRKAGLYSGMGSLIGAGIQAYGSYAGMAALTASSIKLKKDIEIIESPIEKLDHIRGVEFNWKNGDGHDVGVIAEELEKVIPEAVTMLNGNKAVFYYKIIPLLVEVVKKQQKQIEAIKEASHA